MYCIIYCSDHGYDTYPFTLLLLFTLVHPSKTFADRRKEKNGKNTANRNNFLILQFEMAYHTINNKL